MLIDALFRNLSCRNQLSQIRWDALDELAECGHDRIGFHTDAYDRLVVTKAFQLNEPRFAPGCGEASLHLTKLLETHGFVIRAVHEKHRRMIGARIGDRR